MTMRASHSVGELSKSHKLCKKILYKFSFFSLLGTHIIVRLVYVVLIKFSQPQNFGCLEPLVDFEIKL